MHLSCTDGYQHPGADPPYVLDIISLGSGLVSTASDQSLCTFDPVRLGQGPLTRIQTNHGTLSAMKANNSTASLVATTGADGIVSIWDLRFGQIDAPALQLGGNQTSLLSLACSPSSFTAAAGSELENGQASVLLWDIRQNSSPYTQYNEIHSDDITELNFHPTTSDVLLSGSTDGLVNINDIKATDEDDVVITAFNHGSVHRAGFLNASEIYALSHDEQFATYTIAIERDPDSLTTRDFGDSRPLLNCQYVANIFAKSTGTEAVIGAGSQDQRLFELTRLAQESLWIIDTESIVTLDGAHGHEIVRCFCFCEGHDAVFTGGEDGCIGAWK